MAAQHRVAPDSLAGAAKHALRQGMSIVDVAAHVDFADQSHLTRQFKRIVGVTPGQYIRF